MSYKLFFYILISFFIGGCSSSKQVVNPISEIVVEEIDKPDWVKNRPLDSQYYIGIAVASKIANPTTYSTVAQNNALTELASSIEVHVKSNSMLFSFENQNEFKDDFKEFVQVKTNRNIENHELVNTWETDNEYWVYYRLSKSRYKEDNQRKIDKAINLSVTILNQATQDWENGNYRMSMTHYFEALKLIKPYLSESLEITLNNSENVFLGNYLLTQISQKAREFHIQGEKTIINARWGTSIESEDLTYTVTNAKGKPLSQIPVDFSYSEGIIRPRYVVTSSLGKVFTEIKKVGNSNTIQKVEAKVNFQKMVLKNTRPDEIEKVIFKRIANVSSTVKIKVDAPIIYVVSNELSLNRKYNHVIKDAFELKASELGFIIGKSLKNADLVVDISVNTKIAAELYDLKNVLLDAQFKVTQKRKSTIVYQENISNLKGVSSTNNKASEQAYAKAKDQVINKIVPRFYRKYTN